METGPQLSGRRILVVEDEFRLAMELEALLERHGCLVLGPVPTVDRALAMLDGEPPELVLLDVNLKGERATPVAAALPGSRRALRADHRLQRAPAERAGAARRPAHRQAGQLPRARPRRRPGAGSRDTGAGKLADTLLERPRLVAGPPDVHATPGPGPPTRPRIIATGAPSARPTRHGPPQVVAIAAELPTECHCRGPTARHCERSEAIQKGRRPDLPGPLFSRRDVDTRISNLRHRGREKSGCHEPCRRRQEVVWSPRALGRGPERFAFVLVPNFSMIAFAAALEPLRIANRMANQELYAWQIASRDGGSVRASNGCVVATERSLAEVAIGSGRNCPTIILCSGLGAERIHDRELFGWLRQADRAGVAIGAVCTGAHVLAKAGLLDGYKCTIHWENLPGFMEEFPDIDVTADLFEVDRNRLTCSGGTAALDLMLYLIATSRGQELAGKVSEQCLDGPDPPAARPPAHAPIARAWASTIPS